MSVPFAIARSGGHTLAVPGARVRTVASAKDPEVATLAHRVGFSLDGEQTGERELLVETGEGDVAVRVDRVLGITSVAPEDILALPSSITRTNPSLAALLGLPDGTFVLVVDPDGLGGSARPS